MPRWPWTRPQPSDGEAAAEKITPPAMAEPAAVERVPPPEPSQVADLAAPEPSMQRSMETAVPRPAGPIEPRGPGPGGPVEAALISHDSDITRMSLVGRDGGVNETAWIQAAGQRLVDNEADALAERIIDRNSIRRSFDAESFFDSLGSLTSYREQGGFEADDQELVLNDAFAGPGSQGGSILPPRTEAPQRTVGRAVDAKFADPAAPPAPASGLTFQQGAFAEMPAVVRATGQRGVARWAADPPAPLAATAPESVAAPSTLGDGGGAPAIELPVATRPASSSGAAGNVQRTAASPASTEAVPGAQDMPLAAPADIADQLAGVRDDATTDSPSGASVERYVKPSQPGPVPAQPPASAGNDAQELELGIPSPHRSASASAGSPEQSVPASSAASELATINRQVDDAREHAQTPDPAPAPGFTPPGPTASDTSTATGLSDAAVVPGPEPDGGDIRRAVADETPAAAVAEPDMPLVDSRAGVSAPDDLSPPRPIDFAASESAPAIQAPTTMEVTPSLAMPEAGAVAPETPAAAEPPKRALAEPAGESGATTSDLTLASLASPGAEGTSSPAQRSVADQPLATEAEITPRPFIEPEVRRAAGEPGPGIPSGVARAEAPEPAAAPAVDLTLVTAAREPATSVPDAEPPSDRGPSGVPTIPSEIARAVEHATARGDETPGPNLTAPLAMDLQAPQGPPVSEHPAAPAVPPITGVARAVAGSPSVPGERAADFTLRESSPRSSTAGPLARSDAPATDVPGSSNIPAQRVVADVPTMPAQPSPELTFRAEQQASVDASAKASAATRAGDAGSGTPTTQRMVAADITLAAPEPAPDLTLRRESSPSAEAVPGFAAATRDGDAGPGTPTTQRTVPADITRAAAEPAPDLTLRRESSQSAEGAAGSAGAKVVGTGLGSTTVYRTTVDMTPPPPAPAYELTLRQDVQQTSDATVSTTTSEALPTSQPTYETADLVRRAAATPHAPAASLEPLDMPIAIDSAGSESFVDRSTQSVAESAQAGVISRLADSSTAPITAESRPTVSARLVAPDSSRATPAMDLARRSVETARPSTADRLARATETSGRASPIAAASPALSAQASPLAAASMDLVTTIARSFEREGDSERPAPVQPSGGQTEMRPLEQPLVAPPASSAAAGASAGVFRTWAPPTLSSGSADSHSSAGGRTELEYIERLPSEAAEAFGTVTSVQRAANSAEDNGARPTMANLSNEEMQQLSEKVWQFVRRQLRLERERQRGQA